MKSVGVFSMKGGVGKTAFAVNLAHRLSESGRRVLLVDLDPQGAAGFFLRVHQQGRFKSKGGRKVVRRMCESIRASNFPNLDVLPSHLAYRKMEQWLGGDSQQSSVIRLLLEEISGEYDLVLMDMAPGLGAVAQQVFEVVDLLFVPVVPTPLSLRTFEQLSLFLRKEGFPMERLKPFLSMVQNRQTHRENASALRSLEPRLMATSIPFSAWVEKMAERRLPLAVFASRTAAGKAFHAICEEAMKQGL